MSFFTTSFQNNYTSTIPTNTSITPNTNPTQRRNTSLHTALSILHDITSFAHLNPIVTSIKPLPLTSPDTVDYVSLSKDFAIDITTPSPSSDPADDIGPWRQYEITDRVPVVFGYSTNLVYHAAIRDRDDGCESFVVAGGGVRIWGRWKVELLEGGEQDVLVVTEMAEVRCNLLLAWYVRWTMSASHEVMHARLREVWRKRMDEGMGVE